MKLPVHNLKCTYLLSFWLLSLQLSGNSLNPQLNHIFNSLKQVEDSTVQASMLRGTLAGLSDKRDLAAPASWKSLRIKLTRSKDPEVVKLADQLSQIFGDLSVSEDALKVVLNGDANLEDRREALSGLVAMRFQGLPKNLNLLLNSPLKVDAIRAYSYFDYSEAPKELILEYEKFDTVAKRATIDTLASQKSYARALLEALRTEKVAKAEVPNYTARKLKKNLGSSFDTVFGKILKMGELSKIDKNPVKARPAGFADARRIEVGVLPGLKFNTSRIEAKAGEKVIFVSKLNSLSVCLIPAKFARFLSCNLLGFVYTLKEPGLLTRSNIFCIGARL